MWLQIPVYNFCYKSHDKGGEGSVIPYIKDKINCKEQRDLSRSIETMQHIWIECQGKNKNNYIICTF